MGLFSFKKKVSWFKTGQANTRIAVRRFPSEEYSIVITGLAEDSQQWLIARKIGYKPNEQKTELIKHFHEGAKFSPKEFQLIFPQSYVAEVPPDEKFLEAPPTKILGDHLKKLEPIGPNYLHESVFEYKSERFVENARGKIVSERQDNTNNPRFLIAETLSELDLCADGFVQKMAIGQILTPYDLRLFAGQVKRSHLPAEKTEKKLLYVQRSVAAAISRRFSKEFSKPTFTAYNFAVKLTENMPALIYGDNTDLDQARSEISTPLPITVAAQMLLGDAERQRVFAPYAGNGSIIGILPESAYITALQLDDSKKSHIRKLRPNINIVQTDIVDTHFDQKANLTICDLPTGLLDHPTQVEQGLLLHKKDQLSLIRTLEEREDNGVSVFLLTSDQQDQFNRTPGKIGEEDELFYKWLCDHYQVLGAIECHDELYSKQGIKVAKRLLLVGQKLSAGSSLFRSGTDRLIISQRSHFRKDGRFHIDAAYSWQELWDKALFARAALLCHTDPDLLFDNDTNQVGHAHETSSSTSLKDPDSSASTYVSHFDFSSQIEPEKLAYEIKQVIDDLSQDTEKGVNQVEDYHNQLLIKRSEQAEKDEDRLKNSHQATALLEDKNSQKYNVSEKIQCLPTEETIFELQNESKDQFEQNRSLDSKHQSNANGQAVEDSSNDSQAFSFEDIFGKTADLPHRDPSDSPLQSDSIVESALGFSFDELLAQPQQQSKVLERESGSISQSAVLAAPAQITPNTDKNSAPESSCASLIDELAKPDVSYARQLDLTAEAKEKSEQLKAQILRQSLIVREKGEGLGKTEDQSLDILISSYKNFDPMTETGRNANTEAAEPHNHEISISDGIEHSENAGLVDLKEDQNVFKKISQTEIDPTLLLNQLQAPYVTASKLRESRSMAPRALIAAYARAFEKFQNQTKKTVDQYCAEQLQCGEDLLKKLFAEQIDATALALHSMGQGRGFILGDKTGRGKGKTVAAITRAYISKKVPVIFVTKKTNLFSDQWTDLQYLDIADRLKSFVFNSNTPVLDNNREHAFAVMGETKKRRIMTDYVDNDISPFDQFNYFMLTYSQLGMLDTLKAKFFSKLCANGAVLLLDESHIAAGSGNINFTITQAVRRCKSVLYSSATYSKGSKNLAVYSKVLPPTINSDLLSATLEAGGNPLLETLSTQMAEDGVYLSRESDTSKTMRVTLVNERDFFKNRAISDKHAEILSKIKNLSDQISDQVAPFVVKDLLVSVANGQSKEKIKISKYNFNAYLPRMMEQFDLSVSTAMHVRNSLDALENNQKVIVSLVNTNESAIVEILSSFEEDDSIRQQIEDLDPDLDADEIDKLQLELQAQTKRALESAAKSNQTYKGLSYKDLLKRFVNKICKIKALDENGVTHTVDIRSYPFNNLLSEEVTPALQRTRDLIEDISETINLFPSLPISPIDSIKDQIESLSVSAEIKHEEGHRHPQASPNYRVGEISGRIFSLRQQSKDSGEIEHRLTLREENINETVNAFNDGLIDVLILTSSGSTGLSVHAGENFRDRRQRVFLIAQIHPDDTEQQQSEGRADRITQVCTPIIASSRNGLVYQDRRLAMANAKRRTASALTNSSAKNFRNMNDVPDIMTRTGEEVIAQFMRENPDVCRRIGVDLDTLSLNSSRDTHCFSKALFNGLCLLPSDLSEEITQEIYSDLAFRIAEKEANGESENSTPDLDLRAKTESSKLFFGLLADGYLSRFEEPVLLQSIVYREILEPMSYLDVTGKDGAIIKKGVKTRSLEAVKRLSAKGLEYENPAPSGSAKLHLNPQSPFLAALTKKYNDVIKMSLPSTFQSTKEALNSKEDNVVKQTKEKFALIKHYLERLFPGSFVRVSMPFEGSQSGVVDSVFIPSSERQMLNLGQYQVNISIPGRAKPVKKSFLALLKDDSMRVLEKLDKGARSEQEIQKLFEAPQSIVTSKRALVLSNNLLKAAEVVSSANITKPVIISDEKGVKKRVLMVNQGCTPDDLFQIPLDIPNANFAFEFCQRLSTQSQDFSLGTLDLATPDGEIDSSLLLISKNGRMSLKLKNTKTIIKKIIHDRCLDEFLLSPFAHNKGEFTARVNQSNLHEILQRIYLECKVSFKVQHHQRWDINEVLYKDRVKNPKQLRAQNFTKEAA